MTHRIAGVIAFVALAAVVLCAVAPTAAAPIGAANFAVQHIAAGVYGIIRTDPPGLMCDGNSVVIINDADVVVVDAPEASKEVLAAIRTLTSKPVTTVINTHWHDDHITGNQVYRDAFPGVEFIAHTSARDYLPVTGLANRKNMIESAPQGAAMLRGLLEKGKSLTGADISAEERASYQSDVALVDHYMAVVPATEFIAPTRVVDDRLTLKRGRRTIDILHLGAGHTAADLVVHLPDEHVLVTGDLVVWPVPLVGADQSHVREWSATLEKLRALHATTIVPGHGPVMHDDGYVAGMERLFASIRQQVDAAVAAGKTLDETRKLVDLDGFKRAFAGESPVRRVLFGQYVAGPAVASAFREASEAQAARTPPPTQTRADVLKIARAIIEAVRYCAVITVDGSGRPQARELDAFRPDERMVIWFATNPKSRKVAEIRKDPRVTLYYADVKAPGQGYVTVLGHARIVTDPAEKKTHWKKGFEVFWPDRSEGYLLVEVTPDRIEVMSPEHGINGDPVTWTPFIIDMGRAAAGR